MPVIIATILCVYYIRRELSGYYRNKQWKIFYTYSIILLAAYLLSMVVAIDTEIPGFIERIMGK